MSSVNSHLPTTALLAVVCFLSGCATGNPAVVDTLDEETAVTITYVRAPLVLSPDTRVDAENGKDYAQLGAIEVNRMGTLQYYLWLGITDIEQPASTYKHPDGYDPIVLIVDDEQIRLDVLGWTPKAIGASEHVYQSLFSTSADAYYQVTLDQIQSLAYSQSLKLLTTGPEPKEFIPNFREETFERDWSEFVRTVLQ